MPRSSKEKIDLAALEEEIYGYRSATRGPRCPTGTCLTSKGIVRSKLDEEADRIEAQLLRAKRKRAQRFAPYLPAYMPVGTAGASGYRRKSKGGEAAPRRVSRKGGLQSNRKSQQLRKKDTLPGTEGRPQQHQYGSACTTPHAATAAARPSLASGVSLISESCTSAVLALHKSANRFYVKGRKVNRLDTYSCYNEISDIQSCDVSLNVSRDAATATAAAADALNTSGAASAGSRGTPQPPPPRASSLSYNRSADISYAMAANATAGSAGGSLSQMSTTTAAARGNCIIQWGAIAGIELTPPMKALRTVFRFSQSPVKGERAWRRACRRSAKRLERLFNPDLPSDPRRPASAAAAAAAAAASSRQSPNASKRSSISLREYRMQQITKRRYEAQVGDYFSQGASYIMGLWRHNVFAYNDLEYLFSGRYVVPAGGTIDTRMEGVRAKRRKERFFRQIMYNEFGIPLSHNSDSSAGDDDDADDKDDGGTREHSEEGDDETGSFGGGSDDEAGPTGGGGAAETQPFLEAEFDAAENLLCFSLYVGCDANSEGAVFVGRSTAACIDNCRWYITRGVWKGRTVFFQPLPASTSSGGGGGDEDARLQAYVEQTYPLAAESPDAGRRPPLSPGIASLIVGGVCFEKVNLSHQSSTAADPFICTLCGNTRTHNALYISKRTGALSRGSYYCGICRAKTPHVKSPPGFLDRLRELEDEANARLLRLLGSGEVESTDYKDVERLRKDLLRELLDKESDVARVGLQPVRPPWRDIMKVE